MTAKKAAGTSRYLFTEAFNKAVPRYTSQPLPRPHLSSGVRHGAHDTGLESDAAET